VNFLVARTGAQVVGCGASRRMGGEAATDGCRYGEIKRMMVTAEHRGRGVGAALLAQLETQLRDDGATLALLETGADQLEAVRLYQRCGYMQRGAFGGYPDNGLSLFYAKVLG
jgi:putative acetyltransferase